MKRTIPPEIDILHKFCIKEGYVDDANFIAEFKRAMELNHKVSEYAKKRFAEVVLLYKTARILGRA